MRLPNPPLTKRGPAVSNAFIGPALETDNFQHIEFKLPEFSKMARANSPEYRAGADAQGDPRWRHIRTHAKTNPVIPADVRDEAAKHSRALVFSLNTFRSKIIRGQSHGSLDSSRLARLASPQIGPREFERLAATAYRRREHVQSVTTNPRIAIVADMNNSIRVAHTDYMKKLGRLAYIVAEAAKLSGVEVALYASRGQYSFSVDSYAQNLAQAHFGKASTKRPHVVMTAKDWGTDIDGLDYAIMTDAIPGCVFSTPVPLFQAMHQVTKSTGAVGMGSKCGAGGIEFARAQGANMVIAFGNFDATETPDMHFEPGESVEAVISGIVAALANRKAA